MVPLFTAAIFIAAFLLFLIQPFAARLVLPHLGGTPAVWTGTMMFFQFLLLGGYAYAHGLGRLAPRAQAIVHAVVLASCLLFIPLALPAWWGASASMPPLAALLLGLAGSVGIPFFAISSASPLIQSWFARTGHPRAHDPYFLYAASNAGSLLGLLCYPIVVEPLLGLRGQGWLWSIGYFACAALLGACWWFGSRGTANAQRKQAPGATTTKPVGHRRGVTGTPADHPTASIAPAPPNPAASWRLRFAWIALAAAPSSLSLGVTQFLTTDVAAIPLLWVIPLSIYLLTYIVAFSRAGVRAERLARLVLPVCVVAVTAAILMRASGPLLVVGGLHLALLAVAGLACHGRLAMLRPPASRLTEYYFLASLGGALGGAFNALVAPLMFDVVLEYPLAIAASCALMALGSGLARRDDGALSPGAFALLRKAFKATHPPLAPGAPVDEKAPAPATPRLALLRAFLPILIAVLLTGGLVIALEALVALWSLDDDRVLAADLTARTAGRMLTVGVPCILAFIVSRRPLVFAAVVGTLCGQATTVPMGASRLQYDIVLLERSFFGVCMVTERDKIEYVDGPSQPGLRTLQHGTTLHGQQFTDPARADEPLSYYTRRGPVGDTFSRMSQAPRRIAAIGLGVGSVASYGRPGDSIDFFEIDPLVADIAQDPSLFTFLSQCQAEWEIIIGDGRLRIADQPAASYDLIILDAFSSDSIPVHLLTVEAMQLYKARLRPGGALLIHISNQHFRLLEPLSRIARDIDMHAIHRGDAPTIQETWDTGAMFSNWVVLSADQPWLLTFNGAGWEPVERPATGNAWTDDHANLLEAMYFN